MSSPVSDSEIAARITDSALRSAGTIAGKPPVLHISFDAASRDWIARIVVAPSGQAPRFAEARSPSMRWALSALYDQVVA